MPIAWVGDDKTAFTVARNEPILPADHAAVSATGDTDVGVVLLRAENVIREMVVHRDVVKLRGRLIIFRRPRLSAIGRDTGASVAYVANSIRIFGINPKSVMIAMPRG